MSCPVTFTRPVVRCARGAWGNRTHSAYGTVNVAGDVIDWNAYRDFDRSARIGSRVSIDVLLIRAATGRELTGKKWDAAREAVRLAMVAAVRELAESMNDDTPAPVKAGFDSMESAVAATIPGHPVALSLATVAATNARHAREDATARVVGYVDLTPTWSDMLATMLHVYEAANHEGRTAIREEFVRMAALADKYVAAQKAA